MPTPAELFSEFVHGLSYRDIPKSARDAAVLQLVDSVGIAVSTHDMDYARMVNQVVARWGGVPESTVIGVGLRLPAPSAILANGNMIHGVDFDDTHAEGLTHTSACIVPTALAVAERVGADGQALITAIVAGVEVQARIASAAAGKFNARGFHQTFVPGCFAAALTAGKLLQLAPEQLTNALGICGTQSAGLFEWLQDGSWSKRFGPGWAGHGGTVAAEFAQLGYTGPSTIFEGRYGLFRSHVGEGNYSLERLTRGLGSEWETTRVMSKRYPCCHASHAPMNALKEIRLKHSFVPEDVTEVECLVPPEIMGLACEPEDIKKRPQTVYHAQFSVHYEMAAMMVRGSVGPADFTEESIRDPRVLEFASRVKCVGYEPMAGKGGFPGIVVVRLRDGREFRESNEGDLEHPMKEEEVIGKFKSNLHSMPPDQAEQLLAALRGIHGAGDIRSLMSLTAVPRKL